MLRYKVWVEIHIGWFPLYHVVLTLAPFSEYLHNNLKLIVDRNIWSIYLNMLTEIAFIFKTDGKLCTLSKCHV